MPAQPPVPTSRDEANDDGRVFLGSVNKRDHYELPPDGWSSMSHEAALAYLRDPQRLTAERLCELVNTFLRPIKVQTTSQNRRVLLNLVAAFGRLVIELGDPAFARYPYTEGSLKKFSVYFVPHEAALFGEGTTPTQAA